ncbi:hypothetical protein ABMA28_005953 [Loxostege sticticalis]|uniref:Uncharacterized protein n=1 Tax=Loxostege sticticalis TaxID=481309 RepID=A0ABD0SNE7_LOXSC
MPKRRCDRSEEEKIRRKIRRYQRKLANLPNQDILGEYGVPPTPSLHEDGLQGLSPVELMLDELAQLSDVQQPAVPTLTDPGPPPLAPCPDAFPAACPSAVPAPAPLVPAVDPDLLNALGDCHADTPEWGENILDDISQRWEPILKLGLTKDIKEGITKKYLYPKNMPLTKPPLLNPEISAVLTETSRNRDVRVCNKQGQLGHALAALGKVMSGLLTKNMETPEILRILNDAGKIIADSHFSETETRRSLIIPLLEKSFVAPIKDRKRDNYLFGENLGEFIKSSRGIKKTGQLITPSVPSTSGNSKGGPPRSQRYQRGMPAGRGSAPRPQQSYQQRRQQQYQRRSPPPPATRRNPPAPGQPQSGPSRPRNATSN